MKKPMGIAFGLGAGLFPAFLVSYANKVSGPPPFADPFRRTEPMPRPYHFEIHADQPERAITFYQALFGWKFTSWPGPWPYWLIKTGEGEPGIDGGMMKRQGSVIPNAPVIAYVCTMMVTGLDGLVSKALSLGGEMALPKMPIPGMGWLAYVKDTEGNIFGMMEADPKAA